MLQNFLLEATVLLYGYYLLYNSQYITYLILIVMSMIFVLKGISYKESLLFTLIFVLFVTQYHKYFPYRDEIIEYKKNNETTIGGFITEESITQESDNKEGFKNSADLEIKKRAKKNRRSRKKIEKNINTNSKSVNSIFNKRYIHNEKMINAPSKNMGDSWRKWARLKENFYIILNS